MPSQLQRLVIVVNHDDVFCEDIGIDYTITLGNNFVTVYHIMTINATTYVGFRGNARETPSTARFSVATFRGGWPDSDEHLIMHGPSSTAG